MYLTLQHITPRPIYLLTLVSMLGCQAPTVGSDQAGPAPEAAKTVDGTIHALYASVSFDRGGPDWPLFRSLVLPGSVYIFAEHGRAPMKVMNLEAFVQDFRDFIEDQHVASQGFHENLTRIESTEFGNIAHAFTVFEPTIGSGPRKQRGVDSIQLVKKDGRWWVASIATQFERGTLKVPTSFLRHDG
ncbi:MAG: hypothetical protein ACYTGW_04270 [Planctomycetota bacterium]|jgi:hypothetical protein